MCVTYLQNYAFFAVSLPDYKLKLYADLLVHMKYRCFMSVMIATALVCFMSVMIATVLVCNMLFWCTIDNC